jgi:hypothetical protein
MWYNNNTIRVATDRRKKGKNSMKYTVAIDESKKEIKVTLADGTVGVAKCCPTDNFNLGTGIELALERARVAKKNKVNTPVDTCSYTALAKALEQKLPKGSAMLIISGGDENLNEAHKDWLRGIIGDKTCKCKSGSDCYSEEEVDELVDNAYNDGYEGGYEDGYEVGYADCEYEILDEMDEDEESGITDENVSILARRMAEALTCFLK